MSASRKESAFHVALPSGTQAKTKLGLSVEHRNTEWLTAIQTEKTSCRSGNPVRATTRRAGRGANLCPCAMSSCAKCRWQEHLSHGASAHFFSCDVQLRMMSTGRGQVVRRWRLTVPAIRAAMCASKSYATNICSGRRLPHLRHGNCWRDSSEQEKQCDCAR